MFAPCLWDTSCIQDADKMILFTQISYTTAFSLYVLVFMLMLNEWYGIWWMYVFNFVQIDVFFLSLCVLFLSFPFFDDVLQNFSLIKRIIAFVFSPFFFCNILFSWFRFSLCGKWSFNGNVSEKGQKFSLLLYEIEFMLDFFFWMQNEKCLEYKNREKIKIHSLFLKMLQMYNNYVDGVDGCWLELTQVDIFDCSIPNFQSIECHFDEYLLALLCSSFSWKNCILLSH